MIFYFECSGGGEIAYRLNRRAKKNIIVRKASGCLNISAPPWLGQRELHRWLRENGAANGIHIIDATDMTPRETADCAAGYVLAHMEKES